MDIRKVNLVLPINCRGWVIEKMANRLCEGIRERGIHCEVSDEGSDQYDINHSMIFHYAKVQPCSLNTMFVTHLDDQLKVDRVKQHFRDGFDAAICMSSMTVSQLEQNGVESRKLTYVLPAHDFAVRPRRIVVGITTNLYSDGRKREWMLEQLAQDMDLSPFEFRIFGSGWDGRLQKLERSGAVLSCFPPTQDAMEYYKCVCDNVSSFDYYLYMGLDEGSLGTIDALAAGVPTIVTEQGFHLDLASGITFGFWGYDELLAIFKRISHERNCRLQAVSSLSWAAYADAHLQVWNGLRRDGVAIRPVCVAAVAQRKVASMSYVGMLMNADRRRRLEHAVRCGVKGFLSKLATRLR